MTPLQARSLTQRLRDKIVEVLRQGTPFKVWIAHNRHEVEPAAYHAQFCEALKEGGLDITWFGGMSNSTIGVEVTGPETPDKQRLMKALDAAGVRYQPVVFRDDPQGEQHFQKSCIGIRLMCASRNFSPYECCRLSLCKP